MKRTVALLLIALALVSGLTQCKKKVDTIASGTNGKWVQITLDVDGKGDKHIVYPGTGAVVYTDGDVVYVGNNGKYVGSLTYSDGVFNGSILNPSTADYLHFYFVGNLNPSSTPTAGSTTSFTVNIADQSGKLPVLSYAHSTNKYTDGTATYSCMLMNKCGLVKFVPATATSAAIAVGGMKTTATIDFGTPGITPNGTTGAVTLYPESNSAKWAVLLPQAAVSNPAVTISGYASSITSVPEVTNNMYYNTGVGIAMVAAATVTTTAVSGISATGATSGGNVTSAGGGTVSARGVCWSTSASPTISDSHTTNGSGTGSFISSITGLTANTTYHVRAYATNEFGTAYGSDVTFTAANSVPTGAIDGKYTINSNGDKVYFSQGNLQYVGSNGTWKFAEHQYDYLGTTTSQNSNTATVTRDLFGWGTTGYQDTRTSSTGYQTKYYPYSTSQTAVGSDAPAYDINRYGYGPDYDETNKYGLTVANKSDWGMHAITNGGNTPGMWCTLTKDEWVYVFGTRSTTSGVRYAKAEVNGIGGVIILPDDWSTSYYTLSSTNTTSAAFTSNTISLSDWNTKFEANGAVFLPAAGYRAGTKVYFVGSNGNYWSSTARSASSASNVYFGSSYFYPSSNGSRFGGYSVRLVIACE